jgi:hypothetical protein
MEMSNDDDGVLMVMAETFNYLKRRRKRKREKTSIESRKGTVISDTSFS